VKYFVRLVVKLIVGGGKGGGILFRVLGSAEIA